MEGYLTQGSTRRSLLKRGAALLAGAVGVGGASGAATAAIAPSGGQAELTVYGDGFHLHAPSRKAGAVPSKGDSATTYGELLDRVGGAKVGEFRAGFLALGTPFGAGDLAPG